MNVVFPITNAVWHVYKCGALRAFDEIVYLRETKRHFFKEKDPVMLWSHDWTEDVLLNTEKWKTLQILLSNIFKSCYCIFHNTVDSVSIKQKLNVWTVEMLLILKWSHFRSCMFYLYTIIAFIYFIFIFIYYINVFISAIK